MEKDYETGILPFVVMIYLFRVSNQCKVCIGVPSSPRQKHQTQVLLFSQPPYILVFWGPPSPLIRFFGEPHNIKTFHP